MEGLLRRLSSDGSEAENALRVVAFFDRLVQARGGLEELTRSSARLVGGAAGYRGGDPAVTWAFDERGRAFSADSDLRVAAHPVISDRAAGGSVWVQVEDEQAGLSELIVERMALAAGIILSRTAGPLSAPSPLAVQTLLDPASTADEFEAAATLLGLRIDWSVRVLISVGAAETAWDRQLTAWGRTCGIRMTPPVTIGSFCTRVIHDRPEVGLDQFPAPTLPTALGARVPTIEAHRSLDSALRAIRLTSNLLGPLLVDHESIGPLTHVAAVRPAEAARTPLVQQMDFLSQSEVGRGELLALDVFCRHRSLRIAADELALHHSSLAHRLKNTERKLHIDLGRPQTLFEVTLALQLFRVAAWA